MPYSSCIAVLVVFLAHGASADTTFSLTQNFRRGTIPICGHRRPGNHVRRGGCVRGLLYGVPDYVLCHGLFQLHGRRVHHCVRVHRMHGLRSDSPARRRRNTCLRYLSKPPRAKTPRLSPTRSPPRTRRRAGSATKFAEITESGTGGT
jgi:hypothetical protein